MRSATYSYCYGDRDVLPTDDNETVKVLRRRLSGRIDDAVRRFTAQSAYLDDRPISRSLLSKGEGEKYDKPKSPP